MNRKFIILFVLIALVIPMGVSGLEATMGATDWWIQFHHDDTGGSCPPDFDTVTCPITAEDWDGVFQSCGGDFEWDGNRVLFTFSNVTTYLDALHGAGEYTIQNVSHTSCMSGSAGTLSVGRIWVDDFYRTCTLYSNSIFDQTDPGLIGNYADPTDIGGSYRRLLLPSVTANVPTLRYGMRNGIYTNGNSRVYENDTATCADTAVDSGGVTQQFLTYGYELNYAEYWNLTQPENETIYGIGETVYITAENFTAEGALLYNVTYSLNGGGLVSLIDQTNISFNISIGLIPEGAHNISVYFNISDSAADSEFYTRSFTTGNYWNLTMPIEDAQYSTTEAIYVSAEALGVGIDWRVYYRLNNGSWANLLADPTDVGYNVSIGALATTGFYTLDVNHSLVSDPGSSEIFTRNLAIGNIIDFCDPFTEVAFNITFYDELTDIRLNNISYGVTVYTDDNSYNVSQGGYTDGEEVHICATDNSTGFIANFIVEYENATGSFYQRRTYFNVFNYTSTNGATPIFLYLLDESVSTQIQITVVDEDSVPFQQTYVQAAQFNSVTGTYKVVDSLITNEQGRGLVDININERLYKFDVIGYNAAQLFTTITNNVNDDFTIVVISSVEKTVQILNDLLSNLDYSLTFNATNKIISVTWNDISTNLIVDACLRVENTSFVGIGIISNNCSTDATGALTYNYTNDNQTDIKGVFVAKSSQDQNYYDVVSILIQNVKAYLEYKGSGAFYALLIIGTLAGLGVATGSPSFAVIFGLFGLIITYFLGLIAISSFSLWGLVVAVLLVLITRKRVA